jgi:amino acid transporter
MRPQEQISQARKYKTVERQSPNQSSETPGLTTFFYLLAILSLIGGFILAVIFWPGDPGYGNEWKTAAYTWSIIWVLAAIVEAGIFAAIGSVLSYLHRIAINTEK